MGKAREFRTKFNERTNNLLRQTFCDSEKTKTFLESLLNNYECDPKGFTLEIGVEDCSVDKLTSKIHFGRLTSLNHPDIRRDSF